MLQDEEPRSHPPDDGGHSRNGSRERDVGGTENIDSAVSRQDAAAAAAAVSADCTPKPSPQAMAPLALPTATPERRRLAPTEFVTPPSPSSTAMPPQGDDNGENGNLPNGNPLPSVGMPDAVLAKLVRDFDGGGEENDPRGCSSASRSCPNPQPQAVCSSGSDSNVGAVDVEVQPAPSSTSATEHGNDGSGGAATSSNEGRPTMADPVGVVEPVSAKGRGDQQDNFCRWLNISKGYSSSASESGAAGRGDGEEESEGVEGFRGDAGEASGGGDDERSGEGASGGGGGFEKAQRVAVPKEGEELDVPEGEWRRYRGGVEKINN